MLKKLKGFLTSKYLLLLSDTHKQNDNELDVDYLKNLVEILKPDLFLDKTFNLNSEYVEVKSIHLNFEELLRSLILLNNAIQNSKLIYRDNLLKEEIKHDLVNFMINSKREHVNLSQGLLNLKQLLEQLCKSLMAIKNSEKENDKLNNFYLKSYIVQLCDFLNVLIKLQSS